MKLNFNTVAREICKREESNSREVNITDVKRVMRHLFDILGDETYDWIQGAQGYFDPPDNPATAFYMDQVRTRLDKIEKALARKAPNPKRTVTRYTKSKGPRWETPEEKALRDARKQPKRKGR